MHEKAPRRSRERLADTEITEWLRDSIMEGELAPGARLSETAIGKELGVSRTPVREALRVLASEDLIDWQPNRSAVVKQVSNESVIDAVELLGALESLAVRQVCAQADEEAMARLEVAYARFRRQALDPHEPKYFGVNMHLHFAFVDAAGNEMLSRFHRTVVTHLVRARHMINITGRNLDSSLRDHARIFDALLERNSSAAQKAITVHIEHMKRNLVISEAPDGLSSTSGVESSVEPPIRSPKKSAPRKGGRRKKAAPQPKNKA